MSTFNVEFLQEPFPRLGQCAAVTGLCNAARAAQSPPSWQSRSRGRRTPAILNGKCLLLQNLLHPTESEQGSSLENRRINRFSSKVSNNQFLFFLQCLSSSVSAPAYKEYTRFVISSYGRQVLSICQNRQAFLNSDSSRLISP